MRTCVGCRRAAPTTELERVARLGDGSVVVSRRLPGRGAWLCSGSVACFDRAARRNAFTRALRAPVSSEAVAHLRSHFEGPPLAARG